MKKIITLLCAICICMTCNPTIPVNALETDNSDSQMTNERSGWLLGDHYLKVSPYSGSLCICADVCATEKMETLGFKDVIVQYSYNNSDWYDEWNAGDFLKNDVSIYELYNYIMSLERSSCYYRIRCTLYAKKSTFNTQKVETVSNSVWID